MIRFVEVQPPPPTPASAPKPAAPIAGLDLGEPQLSAPAARKRGRPRKEK